MALTSAVDQLTVIVLALGAESVTLSATAVLPPFVSAVERSPIEISRPDLSTDEDLPRIIRSTDPVVVDVPAESCTAGMLAKLRETLAAYPGSTPVMLRVLTNSGVTTMKVGDGYRVDGSEGLLSELRRLLGREHVRAG